MHVVEGFDVEQLNLARGSACGEEMAVGVKCSAGEV